MAKNLNKEILKKRESQRPDVFESQRLRMSNRQKVYDVLARKTKLREMPPDIAEYVSKNIMELL
jgi:hypothetical protein